MKRIILTAAIGFGFSAAQAAPEAGDYLVKFKGNTSPFRALSNVVPSSSKLNSLNFGGWYRVQVPKTALKNFSVYALSKTPGVEYVQPNYKIKLLENPSLAAVKAHLATLGIDEKTAADECPAPGMCGEAAPADNPELPGPRNPGTGTDPLTSNQWGMTDIGVAKAWNKSRGNREIVVAVIDTGVDYTHEDLVENLWRNQGETGTDAQGQDKAKNGVDDDSNGYIDDVIGWDFVSNDNKPYDLSVSGFELIFPGGNPGHGTHCAGNVAARGLNGKGISGVAPNVSIMSLRFLSEKGQGTTADAIKAINYALRNGAHITSNSWGSEGEDPSEDADNKLLKEAIAASQAKGVLFVAAAGNGHNGVGYNNDTDPKPGYPASYDHDIIVSVAALDSTNQLGSFSNWGARTVDIGAPGVKVYSTTVGSKYADTVLDFLGTAITWDGTSMATPHVAGAAALYLSAHPGASWQQVKAALLKSATPVPALAGKAVSNGKLNVERLLEM